MFGQRRPRLPPPTKLLTTFKKAKKKGQEKKKTASVHFCGMIHFNQNIWKLRAACEIAHPRAFVCVRVRLGDSFLLLIDRHEKEVFGENVHVARPRPHPLVPHVTITME